MIAPDPNGPMRPRTAGLSATALAVAASVVLLVGAPASPAARDVVDARGDVWAWSPAGAGEGSFHRSDATANVDVERFSVRHTKRDVVVRIGYADLRRQGSSYGIAVDFRTDEDVRRHASFVANAGSNWLGRTRLLDRDRHDSGCARAHAHVSYRRDTVWLTFPRRCFGSPRWVAFQAMTYRREGDRLLVDNPHNGRPLAQRWSPALSRD